MKKLLTALLLVVLSLSCLMVACNGTTPPPEPEAQKTLAFTEQTATVGALETLQLLVTQENIDEALVFESSDTSKATVNNAGIVTGIDAGTCTITVSADGKSASLTLTVTPVDETKLEIFTAYAQLDLCINDSRNLNVSLYYKDDLVEGGSFTYESQDPEVVTVDKDGKVTALKLGETTIVISGSAYGKNLAQIEIPVVVSEKLTIELESNSVMLYIYEGSNPETLKPTTITLQPTVKLNDEVVEGAVLTLADFDAELVAVDGNTINVAGNKTGETTIKASYTTAIGTTKSVEIYVTVAKPTTDLALENSEFKKQEGKDYAIDLEKYAFASIDKITFNETPITAENFSFDGKILNIKTAVLVNTKERAVDIAAGKIASQLVIDASSERENAKLAQELTVVDFEIGDKAGLDEFVEAVKLNSSTEYVPYVVRLTANIDFQGEVLTTRSGSNGYFAGYFDGQGYAIHNAEIANNTLFWGIKEATFVDVAFTNLLKKTGNDGALFCWNIPTNLTFKNVYLQGTLTAANYKQAGFGQNTAKGLVIFENVLVNVEFTGGATEGYNAFTYTGTGPSGTNAFAVSSTATGLAASEGSFERTGLYATLADFNAALAEMEDVIASFTESGAFVYENGELYFKNAKALEGPAVGLNAEGMKNIEGKYYLGSGEFTITTAIDAVITLKSQIEGVTYNAETKTLVIGADVKVGTEIVLTAEFAGICVSRNAVDLSIFVNKPALKVAGFDYGKNKAENFTINLTEISEEINNVNKVYVAGALVEFTYVEGVLSIAGDKLENSAMFASATKLAYEQAHDLIIETNSCSIETSVIVSDFIIANEDDFTAFVAALHSATLANRRASQDYHAILANNVTLTKTIDNTAGLGAWEGVLDGRGYSLINLTLNNGQSGLVKNLSSIYVKNIAFINARSINETGYGYLFGQAMYNYQKIENCYIEFTTAVDDGQSGLFNGANTWYMDNSIVKFNYASANTAAFRQNAPIGSNIFVIRTDEKTRVVAANSATDLDKLINANKDAAFATYEAMIEALNAEDATITTAGFENNPYWSVVKDGDNVLSLIWKNFPVTEIPSPEKAVFTAGNVANLEADLTAYGFAKEDIQSVVFAGVTIANDKYDIVEGKLVVDGSILSSGADQVVTVSLMKDGALYRVELVASVADYAIANADEFMAWLEAMAGTTADSKDTLTILLADIDLTGKDFSAVPTAKLKGMFDGQGHTVSNIVMTNCGWIHSAFGITIKNTAFVNLQVERASGWGSVFFYNGFTSFQVAFENCYIQYTAKTAGLKFSWTGGNDAWMEMKNVIVDATHTGDTTNGVFRQETPREMENVYVVCSTGNPIGTDASSGASLGTTYASFDALKEVVTDWSAFENEYWDLTAGYPVWKINA